VLRVSAVEARQLQGEGSVGIGGHDRVSGSGIHPYQGSGPVSPRLASMSGSKLGLADATRPCQHRGQHHRSFPLSGLRHSQAHFSFLEPVRCPRQHPDPHLLDSRGPRPPRSASGIRDPRPGIDPRLCIGHPTLLHEQPQRRCPGQTTAGDHLLQSRN
jgi:hypothetical protein